MQSSREVRNRCQPLRLSRPRGLGNRRRACTTRTSSSAKEERFDAHQDGSHITPSEQKAINQQESSVSGKIP
jgi:hypothetical protein